MRPDESRSTAGQPYSPFVRDALQDHLEDALEETDSPRGRYHLRQGLQYLEWLGSLEDGTV